MGTKPQRLLVVALLPFAICVLQLSIGNCPALAQDATPPATVATGGAGPYRIEVTSLNADAFPQITVNFRILDKSGLLARDLPAEEIVILEDNQEVYRIAPKLLREAPSAVMLAIDTSGSMERAQKMDEAKAAAAGFFDRLDPKTPCGLVLFHHEPYLREPPTKSRAPLMERIQAARPKGGTAYIDAVLEALRLFPDTAGSARRAIVLMTDGRDVNSGHDLGEAIQEARRRKVQVYTVGLGEPGRNEHMRTVLVLDRSGSMEESNKMTNLKRAANRFIQLMPPEQADATIIAFNERVPRAAPFTRDKRSLQGQIEKLFPRGGTALFDAVYQGLETLNAGRAGAGKGARRSLVVLTDGKDNDSRLRDEDVIERAKRDEVPIYTLGLGSGDELDEPAMRRMAERTGGRYFHVEDSEKLTEIFENLSIDLHDEGIDEASLKRLAKDTNGEYFHVREADNLRILFEQVATKLDNTYTVNFKSRRATSDGTARSVDVRLGAQGAALAVATGSYNVHGLIVPQSNPLVYVAGLAVLLLLLGVPALLRRRENGSNR